MICSVFVRAIIVYVMMHVLCDFQTEEGWIDLSPGQNFTQEDVEMNCLRYTHTKIVGFKGHDRLQFVLSDGENTSPPQTFFISVRIVQKGEFLIRGFH